MKTKKAAAETNGSSNNATAKRHQSTSVKDAIKEGKSKKSQKETLRKGKLGSILGHSVVSVVRAMGKAGWDFDTAKAALGKAKIEAAEHTIRVGLRRGRENDKTRTIAPLSAKELNSLKAK